MSAHLQRHTWRITHWNFENHKTTTTRFTHGNNCQCTAVWLRARSHNVCKNADKRETLKFHLSSGCCMFRDENTKCSGSNKTHTDHAVLMDDNNHGHWHYTLNSPQLTLFPFWWCLFTKSQNSQNKPKIFHQKICMYFKIEVNLRLMRTLRVERSSKKICYVLVSIFTNILALKNHFQIKKVNY